MTLGHWEGEARGLNNDKLHCHEAQSACCCSHHKLRFEPERTRGPCHMARDCDLFLVFVAITPVPNKH